MRSGKFLTHIKKIEYIVLESLIYTVILIARLCIRLESWWIFKVMPLIKK